MADKFIILRWIQFGKNGFQNRCRLSSGEWLTKPVHRGLDVLGDKEYVDGMNLVAHNLEWIIAIKNSLNIKAEICLEPDIFKGRMEPTDRLISLIKYFEGTAYITNPDAKEKYLDEDAMRYQGIDVEYCKVPKNLNIPIFDAFNKFGIEGTIRQLPKAHKLCKV